MSGLFSALNIGTRGLYASQLAMDVAGQNISNADVEGYSRKRLNLAGSYRYDAQFGQMGMGVDVISIERMRNQFIDEQIRKQNQEVGFYTQVDQTLESVENIFTEPTDTGIMHFVDQFFDSWQNLANNPTDTSARTMVKTNAEIMTDAFHSVSKELMDLRQTRNQEIEQRVNKVNEISREIYNLNMEIGVVEVGKQNANDSRDRRDVLLKELSKIVDTFTIENEQGQITVTTGGNVIVSPVNYTQLESTTRSFVMADGTTMTNVGIRFSDSKKDYNPQGGEIKGLFESRDNLIPEYQKKIDTLAKTLVKKINDIHTTGYNLSGYNGINFFDPGVTGASDMKLSASILSNVQNIAAASGGEAFPAQQTQLAAGAHNFGVSPIQLYRNPGAIPLVEAHNILQNTVIVRTPTATLTEGVDYHIDYTNGTIQSLHNGFDGQNLSIDFQYRTGGFKGPGDNTNAVAIAKIRSNLTMNNDVLGNPQSSFTEYYSAFIGRLGLSRNEAESNLDTRNNLVAQYEQHQDAIAGVSLDEEMANLVKYQHTYQAAARLISTTEKMLDVLLNM